MRTEQHRGLKLITRPTRVEASLWRRLRLEAETACRETLFNRYADYARAIARRFFKRRSPPKPELSDYQQFAYEGLLQAIDRFDPLNGAPFRAFARRRIAGSIVDGLARMSELDAQVSHRSRMEQERVRSLTSERETEGGEALPALSELAVELALGLILEGTSLLDPRPTAYESLVYRQMQTHLAEAVQHLPEKEAAVIRQHYENGLSFVQIARLLNLSRGRISQLHRAALKTLRKRIGTLA